MRMRFKLRTLLAVVALTATALAAAGWGLRLRERSRSYREWAAIHELGRQGAEAMAKLSGRTAEQKAASKEAAAWRAARRDEYLGAARAPWREGPAPSLPPGTNRPLVAPAKDDAPEPARVPEANRQAYANQMAHVKESNPALYAERVAKYGPPGAPDAATVALLEQLRKTRERHAAVQSRRAAAAARKARPAGGNAPGETPP